MYGANVRLLDGKALASLDRLAALNSGTFIKERLSGLLLELRFNRMTVVHTEKRVAEFVDGGSFPMARLRLVATQAVLGQPILMIEDFVNALHRYWGRCTVLNGLLDAAIAPMATVEFRRHRAQTAIGLVPFIEEDATIIEGHVTSHLAAIGTTIASTLSGG